VPEGPKTKTLLAHGIAVALVAAFLEQIIHEASHAVAATILGKKMLWFNFFATASEWPNGRWSTGDGIVAGNAALVNILSGAAALALFYRPMFKDRPTWRLFLMYFAGFSLAAGFGYLMVDPLFYKPGSANLGDWKRVVDLLGGGWSVRAPIAAVGAAGSVFVFLWLPRAVLRFGTGMTDRPNRTGPAYALLLIPYLTVCALVTVFALWHPVGPAGLLLMVFKYWLGYSAFLWGCFIAGYWMTLKAPITDASTLPDKIPVFWLCSALTLVVFSAAVLLPTIRL
jgi:hypothetical protein